MATSAATNYSSGPYSCDQPTKITSVRKLRSRKVITTIESPRKVNIGTRGSKGLRATVNSTSMRKYKSNKIHKDVNSHDKSSEAKKTSNKEEKIHKEEKSGVVSSNVSKNKRRKNVIKNKETINNPVALRQMSLKESFAYQSISNRLRPRRNKRNCEDSKLLQQHLSQKQQNSVVMLEKLDVRDVKKVPVYKTVRTSEVCLQDNNDIYDFTYDSNDTKEKLAKKRKRRNIKRVGKKIVKSVIRKKIAAQSKAADGGNKSSDCGADLSIEIQSKETGPVVVKLLAESKKEDALDKIDTPRIDTETQIVREISSPDQRPTEQIRKQDIKKPRIISIEDANNITVTRSSPGWSKSEDTQPFRPTNIFHNKNKNTLSCSLLTKSLSPILKTCDTFDPGSPWRSPAIPMFFQTKHFVQSTPNVSKVDAVQAKPKMHIKDEPRNNDKMANVSDVICKNKNSTMQNVSDRTSHKRKSNLCRKFGTEITNIEHNNSSMNQDNNTEIVHDRETLIQTETRPVSSVQLNAIASESSNYSSFDVTDDKENAAPNYQTPKKRTKKGIKQRHLPNSSSSKACEIRSKLQRENVEPQPGPSYVEDLDKCSERKTLRQSNLNNFLNIMNMPENTRISTKHGIFDDVRSTPISSNVVKRTIGLENAFGFCEKESELDISPIENELVSNHTSKPLVQPPARLSSRELRNRLLPRKPNNNNDDDDDECDKTDNVEDREPPLVQKDKQRMDTVDFSDTFDVLSECERLSNRETDVPLFVDLEPSHFSKPPRHTYKRKHSATFLKNNSEEEEKDVKTHTKKKKFRKLEKEDRRRLDEWVKTVNSTFQEIDEYDLIVE